MLAARDKCFGVIEHEQGLTLMSLLLRLGVISSMVLLTSMHGHVILFLVNNHQ